MSCRPIFQLWILVPRCLEALRKSTASPGGSHTRGQLVYYLKPGCFALSRFLLCRGWAVLGSGAGLGPSTWREQCRAAEQLSEEPGGGAGSGGESTDDINLILQGSWLRDMIMCL